MRILVVEDEAELATAVSRALRQEAFAVDVADTLADARLQAEIHDYDAVVLDRRLPDGEGLELCRHWRDAGRAVPVLMLTALDGTPNVVAGLDAGADDYLTKPFAIDELLARLRSLVRRGPALRRTVVRAGGLEIDVPARRVRRDGVAVPLTAKEFTLLAFLADRAGSVVDRFDILEHCWDHAYEPESNVVDVHVGALRRKLGADAIETVRGAGYRLADQPGPQAAPPQPAAAPAPEGTVTLMFTDIEGSTRLNESMGDQRWHEILGEHDALVRALVAEYGGQEVQALGDGFMLAFSSARRALRCAIQLQRALAAREGLYAEGDVRVRIGLHTGEVISEDESFVGRHVAMAARVAAQAAGGEILASDLLRQLTESSGEVEFGAGREVTLKGFAGVSRVYEVAWQP